MNGTITANEMARALSAHLETRKETALPHDDFMAGMWACAKIINSKRDDVVLVPVIEEVS